MRKLFLLTVGGLIVAPVTTDLATQSSGSASVTLLGDLMSGFKLQRLGLVMEPEAGNLQEIEGLLNPVERTPRRA
jgi:hypothetical protein